MEINKIHEIRSSQDLKSLYLKKREMSFVHELGHALGFTGHSPYSNDTMYTEYQDNNADAILTNTDKQSLKQIYASLNLGGVNE